MTKPSPNVKRFSALFLSKDEEAETEGFNFFITKVVLAPVPGFPSLYFADADYNLSIALCLTPLYAVVGTRTNTLTFMAKVVTPKSQGLTRSGAAKAVTELFNQINTDLLAPDSLEPHENYMLDLVVAVECPPKVESEQDDDVYMVSVSIVIDKDLYDMGTGMIWAQNEAIVSTARRLLLTPSQDPTSLN